MIFGISPIPERSCVPNSSVYLHETLQSVDKWRKMKVKKFKKMKFEQVEDDLCLPFLYDLPLPSSLVYIQSSQEMKFFHEIILTKKVCVIGIDTETEPLYGHKTSLIQLAIRYEERSGNALSEENGKGNSHGGLVIQHQEEKENLCHDAGTTTIEERIFILDLLQLSDEDHDLILLNQIFQLICRNNSIVKIAHGLKQDAAELITSYPTLTSLNQITMVLETNSMHQKLNPQIVLPVSLKYLARHYLNSNLVKAHQCSSWGSRPLTPGQLNYAACDALVLLRLYDAMCFEIEDVFLECDLQECLATIDLTKACDSPSKKSFREIRSPSPFPSEALSPTRLSPSLTLSSTSSQVFLTQKGKQSNDSPQNLSRQKKRRKVFESSEEDRQKDDGEGGKVT
jgi:hypothetical protein